MEGGPAALAGWKREECADGIALTLQLARSLEQFHARRFDRVTVVLNDRQLRSLARDLARATDARGSDVFHRPVGWRRWLRRFRWWRPR